MQKYRHISRPRYIQLTSSYAPAWGFGGPIRLMLDYAKWMRDYFDIAVFTGNINHEFNAYLENQVELDGIVIKRFRVILRSLAKRNINLISPLMFIRAFHLLINSKSNTNIIHICELRGLVPIYALLLKRIFSNHVVLVHSAFGMLQHKSSLRRRVFDSIFLQQLIRSIDIELVQNKNEKENFKKICSYLRCSDSAVYLLPLHVPLILSETPLECKNRNLLSQLRIKYGLPEDAFICLFLGRFCREKGIIRTIDAFMQFIKKTGRYSFLLIIGKDFNFRHELEEYSKQLGLSSFIRIIENVYEERFDYYRLSDLFLGFPIIYEETMLASVEALGCGTPVVVSREADIPFVEESGAGHVIDYSIESAVFSIEKVSQNLTEYERNAANVARSKFNERKLKKNLISMFLTVRRNEVKSI